MLLRDVVDELLDEDCLADGAAEEADLAALDVRGDEVDDLDASLERLDLRREVAELGRVTMDRPALRVGRDRLELVDRLADHVPEPPEVAYRDGDRSGRVDTDDTPREPVRRVHGERRARGRRRGAAAPPRRARDPSPAISISSRVDLGEPVGEDCVDDDALDLDDPARVRAV